MHQRIVAVAAAVGQVPSEGRVQRFVVMHRACAEIHNPQDQRDQHQPEDDPGHPIGPHGERSMNQATRVHGAATTSGCPGTRKITEPAPSHASVQPANRSATPFPNWVRSSRPT